MEVVQPETRACPACGSDSGHSTFSVNGYDMKECDVCGTLYVERPPATAELEAIYAAPNYRERGDVDELRFAREAGARADILDQQGCRSVLEIGCAEGFFLDAARARGMHVEALEPGASANRAIERGHVIHRVWLREFEPSIARFDGVAMWDVLEHLVDPRQALAHASSWLREGGVLAISTPSWSGLAARMLGRKFPMVIPPEHLEVFTRRGLEHLLARTGFRSFRWTSYSNLGCEQLDRGFQRYLLGSSRPARLIAAAFAHLGARPFEWVDRLGWGISYELYARKLDG